MQKKFFKIIPVIIFVFIFNFFFLGPASADQEEVCRDGKCVEIENPLGETTEPSDLIGDIINAVMGIVGSLALLMFIYGGLVWMTAAGNNEKVEKGKNILAWATIGLVVIFSSYVMVSFVFTSIGA